MKEIILYKNRGVALVDDEDYNKVMASLKPLCNWCLTTKGYVKAYCRKHPEEVYKLRFLHYIILDYDKTKFEVDHIYKDKLDNRKSQLRICTRSQNACNSRTYKGSSSFGSKYRGVSRSGSSWKVSIKNKGKIIFIGTYSSEIEAALAYNTKAIELHGDYAQINATSL